MAFFFLQSREMPIQTKSTQAREERKWIRSSICFAIPSFESVWLWVGVYQSFSVLRSDQSRWVCVGTIQWQRMKQGSVGVIWAQQDSGSGRDNSWRWRRSAGEVWEWAGAVERYWLGPDSHALAHRQCAANVAFFKLKFDQLMERRWRVCRAESRQNLQRGAKMLTQAPLVARAAWFVFIHKRDVLVDPRSNGKCWLCCVMVTLQSVSVATAVTSNARRTARAPMGFPKCTLTFWNIPPPSQSHPSRCCPGRCLWARRHRLGQNK